MCWQHEKRNLKHIIGGYRDHRYRSYMWSLGRVTQGEEGTETNNSLIYNPLSPFSQFSSIKTPRK